MADLRALISPLRLLAIAAVALLLAVPLACGDDDDTATAPTSSDTTALTDTTPDTATTSDTTGGATETTSGPVQPPPLPSDDAAAAAVQQYRAYLNKQAAKFVALSAEFSKHLRQGKPARAQALYGDLRKTYESIQPAAAELGLDGQIAAREGEADGDWTGLHAIEKTLFDTGTTVGTEPLGKQLVGFATELRNRVPGIELGPAKILTYGAAQAKRPPDRTSKEEEEAYSRLQLAAVSGDIVGARAAYEAVRPIVKQRSRRAIAGLDQSIADTNKVVESLRTPDGYRRFDDVTENDWAAILEGFGEVQTRLESAAGLVAS